MKTSRYEQGQLLGPHAIGTERFAMVSSGSSFAQAADPILGKHAWVQNPDKDEVQVLIQPSSRLGPAGSLSVGAACTTSINRGRSSPK